MKYIVIRFSLLVVLFAALVFADLKQASAAFVLEFGRSGVVASNGGTFTTSAVAGGTISLEIYLTQTSGEGRLSDSSTGVAIADLQIAVTSGGAELVPISFELGPGFVDDQQGRTGIAGQTVRLAMVEPTALGFPGVTASSDGVADNSVRLGTINYTLGADAGVLYEVTATASTGIFPFALAGGAAGSFPVNVTAAQGTAVIAVPEPSAFALMGLGALFVGYRQRRRSKAKRATETR